METKITFEKELESLINRHCKENDSNTPDFILAEYIQGCLKVYAGIINKRDKWFDFVPFGRLNVRDLEISKDKEIDESLAQGHPKFDEAVRKVCEELCAMPEEEFYAELEKHKDGDIAQILRETGAITYIMEDFKNKQKGEENG